MDEKNNTLNILVTSGAGYNGSVASEELLKSGHRVIQALNKIDVLSGRAYNLGNGSGA